MQSDVFWQTTSICCLILRLCIKLQQYCDLKLVSQVNVNTRFFVSLLCSNIQCMFCSWQIVALVAYLRLLQWSNYPVHDSVVLLRQQL